VSTVLAAVDLGASSGRVVAAVCDGNRIGLDVVARFPNRAVAAGGRLYWDVFGLWSGVLDGLRTLGDAAAVAVDSWAVDYALLNADGDLVGTPVCYRDPRGAAARETVLAEVDAERLYRRTGVQPQPFNTIFQLAAEHPDALEAADRLLLVPDLFGYWLSGVYACEATNASTTGLVDQGTGTWAHDLCTAAGAKADLLGQITATGTVLGGLTDAVAADTGLGPGTQVVATASHDTAAAVAAVPYATDRAAYISCGTWSLVGVERHVLGRHARSETADRVGGEPLVQRGDRCPDRSQVRKSPIHQRARHHPFSPSAVLVISLYGDRGVGVSSSRPTAAASRWADQTSARTWITGWWRRGKLIELAMKNC
jgi:rhamnulokinase